MTTSLKWAPLLRDHNFYGEEVINKFSEECITLTVGVRGLSESDCCKFLCDLEKIINKELAETYGETSFEFCAEYGAERENTLYENISFDRCKGEVADQKKEIMEVVRRACTELKKQYQ